WEVTAGAELRNAKFYCSGPRLPVSVAVAVALGQPKGILLAIGSTRLRADLQFHQLLGGKADHLAQQIGVSTLLNERAQVHHIVGHRWTFHQVELEQPDPTGKTLGPPLSCYTTPRDIILFSIARVAELDVRWARCEPLSWTVCRVLLPFRQENQRTRN